MNQIEKERHLEQEMDLKRKENPNLYYKELIDNYWNQIDIEVSKQNK